MVLLVGVLITVKKYEVLSIFNLTGISDEILPLIVCIALCVVSATNNLTSVSVSLEGKNISLLQSFPCEIRDIFFGKIMMHIVLTAIPLIVSSVIVLLSFQCDLIFSLCFIIFAVIFSFVCATGGLIINLLFPKLEWINETVPIKQSLSSVLGILSGFLMSGFCVGFSFILADIIGNTPCTIALSLIFAVILLAMMLWLKNKGKERFRAL